MFSTKWNSKDRNAKTWIMVSIVIQFWRFHMPFCSDAWVVKTRLNGSSVAPSSPLTSIPTCTKIYGGILNWNSKALRNGVVGIGQEAGIRARTVRFTGGDAAVTPQS